jgi:glucose-6-phosphate isomerase
MQFLHSLTSGVPGSALAKSVSFLSEYADRVKEASVGRGYLFAESSVALPFDEDHLDSSRTLADSMRAGLKYILLVGIGGSNLGARAVYDALFGNFDAIEPERFPKMICLDTVDPEYIEKIKLFLATRVKDKKELVVVVISKSGTTTETVFNAEVVTAALKARFGEASDRIVAITDEGSLLWQFAGEKKIARLAIPKIVGGRYSVFSAVGVFPLLLCGIDVGELLRGARDMAALCVIKDSNDNPAMLSASIIAHHGNNGKNINDNFFFHPELESLGKWYRQLMGESIGKEFNDSGKMVNAGITPTVSVGSTDLHSLAQLYLGGPKDKLTTFVWASSKKTEDVVSDPLYYSGLADAVAGKRASEIMTAIYGGVKAAYQKNGLPFTEIVFGGLSPYAIGEYMQFKMCEMMYLAQLLHVNAFDQPAVEKYKEETRSLLSA